MAATDLDDLNNYEYHWETAAVTFLNSDVGIQAVRTITEDSLVMPRIEIQFKVGDAFEPFAPRNGGGSSTTQDYRAFNSSLEINLVTDNATGGSALHATYRSKVRTALMRSGTNWNSTNLAYYDLKEIRPDGTEYDAEGDMNISQLNYSLVWEIRDDAWPV